MTIIVKSGDTFKLLMVEIMLRERNMMYTSEDTLVIAVPDKFECETIATIAKVNTSCKKIDGEEMDITFLF